MNCFDDGNKEHSIVDKFFTIRNMQSLSSWKWSLSLFVYLHVYLRRGAFVHSFSNSHIIHHPRPTVLRVREDTKLKSYIENIKVKNFGSVINGDREKNGKEDLIIKVACEPNLVAVTGETGSGKSLLVAKVIEYLMGCKASPSIIPSSGDKYAAVKVVIRLTEPHITATTNMLQEVGLDPSLITSTIDEHQTAKLELTRMIIENETKSSKRKQLKSICKINGKLTTLKVLKYLITPLIAIVDASAASSALKDPKARMAILDSGVDSNVLKHAKETRKRYRECRQYREKLEKELQNRILPSSFSNGFDEGDIEMLRHWIDEIDDFEIKMNNFQDSITTSLSSINGDDDERARSGEMDGDDYFDENKLMFQNIVKRFSKCSWESDANKDFEQVSINDSFYSCLLDLRSCIKSLDDQLVAAHASCDVLTSLSTSESAAYALERSRNFLYDITSQNAESSVEDATEKAHELLNRLEGALKECSRFMEDDPKGLVATLEKMREKIFLSVDEITEIVADWGSLSRKHGIDVYSLPCLQRSLKQELDGNVEAKQELPKAIKLEEEALEEYVDVCKRLTKERASIASRLSESVTERIKSLGMEGSAFHVDFHAEVNECSDPVGYSESSPVGIDTVSFLLLHRQINQSNNTEANSDSLKAEYSKNDQRGGKLDIVGSSGEKARILLAIETELPGSVGACCNKASSDMFTTPLPPIAVVYDEIDAHVGGRAAVALAKLLSDQTRVATESRPNAQIISITHSPAVAAIADRHLVIHKLPMNIDREGRVEVTARSVIGSDRREELSRMAAGDLGGDEGLRFAEALLREGTLHKER